MSEFTNEQKRQKFSEHLLHQVAGGMRDARWTEEAHAFLDWCYRLDNHKLAYEESCQNCPCQFHDAGACGNPLIGEGYPYHRICLCQSKRSTTPSSDITIDGVTLRFAFDWMDAATDILRAVKPLLDEATQGRIAELMKQTEVSVMDLITKNQRTK